MFSWFRRGKKSNGDSHTLPQPTGPGPADPSTEPAAPAIDHAALLQMLSQALAMHGHEVATQDEVLIDPRSQFQIVPVLRGQQMEPTRARTMSTVHIKHPQLPDGGIYEYQHSWGPSIKESIFNGFDRWVQTDYAVLVESLQATPKQAMTIKMDFPEKDGQPARHRRVVLGPVEHLKTQTPVEASETKEGEAEEHAFCPCCLLTQSLDAFKSLIESDETYGVRLFASRDKDGNPAADCRVNGEDYEPGKIGPANYAKTWKPSGIEFRKQYVVIQNAPWE